MSNFNSRSNLPLYRFSYPERGETIASLIRIYIRLKRSCYPECCFDDSSVSIWHNVPNYPKMVHLYNMLRVIIAFYRFLDKIFEEIEGTDLEKQLCYLKITSCFRSPRVNAKVRGSDTSLHLDGMAIDIWAPSNARPLLEFIYSKMSAYTKTSEVVSGSIMSTSDSPFVYPYEVILYGSKNQIHIGYTYVNPNLTPLITNN